MPYVSNMYIIVFVAVASVFLYTWDNSQTYAYVYTICTHVNSIKLIQ